MRAEEQTHRTFRLLAGLLLWILPGSLQAEPALSTSPPSFFIQMADTQFGMYATPLLLAYFGLTWRDDEFTKETELFERAIAHANRLRPGFVVVCGDLVNKPGHEGQAAEFDRIRRTLRDDVPIHLVAGNHDVENEPTPESLAWYRKTFGKDWYVFREGTVQGVVLDSNLIQHPQAAPEETARQLEWLKRTLAAPLPAGVHHRLVFQHHSFFLEHPEEEDQYFNLPREQRRIYLPLLQEHGVRAVFAGHYHRNALGRVGALEMITTGPVGLPLGDDPSGFRVVRVGPEGIEHSYYGLDEVPAAIELPGAPAEEAATQHPAGSETR